MLGLSFFNRPKPRQFNYQPLYYDPKKEEMDAKKRRVLGDAVQEETPAENYIPGSFIQKARRNRIVVGPSKEQTKKTMLIRFVIFLVILCFVAYMIIASPLIEIFLKKLG